MSVEAKQLVAAKPRGAVGPADLIAAVAGHEGGREEAVVGDVFAPNGNAPIARPLLKRALDNRLVPV